MGKVLQQFREELPSLVAVEMGKVDDTLRYILEVETTELVLGKGVTERVAEKSDDSSGSGSSNKEMRKFNETGDTRRKTNFVL